MVPRWPSSNDHDFHPGGGLSRCMVSTTYHARSYLTSKLPLIYSVIPLYNIITCTFTGELLCRLHDSYIAHCNSVYVCPDILVCQGTSCSTSLATPRLCGAFIYYKSKPESTLEAFQQAMFLHIHQTSLIPGPKQWPCLYTMNVHRQFTGHLYSVATKNLSIQHLQLVIYIYTRPLFRVWGRVMLEKKELFFIFHYSCNTFFQICDGDCPTHHLLCSSVYLLILCIKGMSM